ncbi:porin family protein [Shewanella canadensis]|uniref:Porin family protein n=1 Tax=Shewanella canadensis TaxID=271096 RepID=A0A3S0IT75_9GAMM|nr:outer membrane beta-barrel protein [Shewanella canadensis]RTR39197.1 porin family protein [Shewanella canadensis]
MKKLYSILFCILLSNTCFADDGNINNNTKEDIKNSTKTSFNKTHTLGIGFGMLSGTMEVDYVPGDPDSDSISFSEEYFYQFHIDNNWAVAVGYQETSSGFCIICTPLNGGSEARYVDITRVDNIYITAQYTYPISQRWAIYTKVGFNRYDLDYEDGRYTDIIPPSRDDIGVDLAAGLGIKFQAFNGFGIGLDYKYLGADKVQTKVGVLTISYSF